MNHISENLKFVKDSINEACSKNNIDTSLVNLIAVSKTFDCSYIQSAYDEGIRDFGENKVQEFLQKYDYFNEKYSDIRWHLIGHLQTNKVKSIIGKTALIHSVDSLHLAEEINKQSLNSNIKTNILIQVNTSKELTKFGVDENECIGLIEECSKLSNITINGIMTIAQNTDDEVNISKNFKKAKELYDQVQALNLNNVDLKYLSMGMSSDFKIAIAEGANMLRLGTIIFGNRNYNLKNN